MQQTKRIEPAKIKFEYDDKALPDEKHELSMVHNVNMWLSPYVDEINAQEGVIKIFFKLDKTTHLYFDQMNDDFIETLHKQLEPYLHPRNP